MLLLGVTFNDKDNYLRGVYWLIQAANLKNDRAIVLL